MILRRVAVVLAAVVLVGCDAVISGAGRRASAPLPLGLEQVRRESVRTALGDPALVDLCEASPAVAIFGTGTTEPREYRESASCTWDASVGAGARFRIDATVADRATQRPGRRLRTVGDSVVFEADGGTCARIARRDDLDVGIVASPAFVGRVRPNDYCDVTDRLATDIARMLGRGRVPVRPFAARSVTTIDPCRMLTRAQVARLFGLIDAARLTTVKSGAAGTSCLWSVGGFVLVIDSGSSIGIGLRYAETRTFRGHPLIAPEQDGTSSCFRLSRRGTVPESRAREYLRVTVSSPVSACAIADSALATALDAAGLR